MSPVQQAAVIAEIYIGIAMAKSRGVICGPPMNITITPIKAPR